MFMDCKINTPKMSILPKLTYRFTIIPIKKSNRLLDIEEGDFKIYMNMQYLLQSILKEISPGISLEGMMLKLKLQYFGHLMRRVDSLEKTDAGRDWGQEEKGTTEDEMAGGHH